MGRGIWVCFRGDRGPLKGGWVCLGKGHVLFWDTESLQGSIGGGSVGCGVWIGFRGAGSFEGSFLGGVLDSFWGLGPTEDL